MSSKYGKWTEKEKQRLKEQVAWFADRFEELDNLTNDAMWEAWDALEEQEADENIIKLSAQKDDEHIIKLAAQDAVEPSWPLIMEVGGKKLQFSVVGVSIEVECLHLSEEEQVTINLCKLDKTITLGKHSKKVLCSLMDVDLRIKSGTNDIVNALNTAGLTLEYSLDNK